MDLRPARTWTLLVAISALFGLAAWNGIDHPSSPYYDEVYHVPTAHRLLAQGQDTTNSHPVLGNLLIASSIRLFGDRPLSWRLPSLMSGVLTIVALGALLLRLTGRPGVALLAAAVLAADGVTLTQARVGMLNSPMLALLMCALWCAHRAGGSGRWTGAVICGVLFGAAVATRWVALWGLPLMFWCYRSARTGIGARPLREGIVPTVSAAIVTYLAVHLPVVAAQGWDGLADFQRRLFVYHWTLAETHLYGSPWWSWPLLLRPIWYVFDKTDGVVRGILCVGNPAVFWLLPLAAWGAVAAWRRDPSVRPALSLALGGFLCLWLPWAIVRRVQFFHYVHTALPFAAVVWAVMLDDWLKGPPARRMAAIAVLLTMIVCAVWWYPIWTGQPLSVADYQKRLLLKSWI